MKGALSSRLRHRLIDGVDNLANAMKAQVAVTVSVDQVERACFVPGLLKELTSAVMLLEAHNAMWGGGRETTKIRTGNGLNIDIHTPSGVVVPYYASEGAPFDGGELYNTLRKWVADEKEISTEVCRIRDVVCEVNARCKNVVQLRHFLPCVLTLAASSADPALQAKLEPVHDYVAPRSVPILSSELLAECKWANETVAMWSLLPPPSSDNSPTHKRVRISLGY